LALKKSLIPRAALELEHTSWISPRSCRALSPTILRRLKKQCFFFSSYDIWCSVIRRRFKGIENVVAAVVLVVIAVAVSQAAAYMINTMINRQIPPISVNIIVSDVKVLSSYSGQRIIIVDALISPVGSQVGIANISIYIDSTALQCSILPRDVVGSMLSPGKTYKVTVQCPVDAAGQAYMLVRYCRAGSNECYSNMLYLGSIQ
jgi:hypothetical protein